MKTPFEFVRIVQGETVMLCEHIHWDKDGKDPNHPRIFWAENPNAVKEGFKWLVVCQSCSTKETANLHPWTNDQSSDLLGRRFTA